MKVFRITDKATQEFEGVLNYQNKTEKSIEQLSGNAEMKMLHGIKLWVDPSGTVINGPDIFISRKWDDIQRLNFNDTFTAMRSVARAIMATNKSLESDVDKIERKKYWDDANKQIDQAIQRSKDYENLRIK